MAEEPSAVSPPRPLAAPVSLRPVASLDLTPEKGKRPIQHHTSHAAPPSLKSKALQELNVPSHVNRYRHLQQIDLSDTSFEELLLGKTKPNQVKPLDKIRAVTCDKHSSLPKPSSEDEAVIRESTFIGDREFESHNKPHPLLTPSRLYHETLAADNILNLKL